MSVERMVGVVLLQAGRQHGGSSFSVGELQMKLLGLSPLQQ